MTQEVETLITDEMRATVGVESEPTILEVDRTGIRMFARAVQQVDQIFYDAEYAKSKGHRDVVAPPGYFGTPVYNPQNPVRGPGTQLRCSWQAAPFPQRRQRVRVHRHRHLRRRHDHGGLQGGQHERAQGQPRHDGDHAPRDDLHEPGRRGRGTLLRHQPRRTRTEAEMAEQVYWQDVKEGDEIPHSLKTARRSSWCTGLPAPATSIRSTTTSASHRHGLKDIIVHGALKGAFLASCCTTGPETAAGIKSYGCSYRGMDYTRPGHRLQGHNHQESTRTATITSSSSTSGPRPAKRTTRPPEERGGHQDDAGHRRRHPAVALERRPQRLIRKRNSRATRKHGPSGVLGHPG